MHGGKAARVCIGVNILECVVCMAAKLPECVSA